MNPEVDNYIERADQWRDEFITLRAILLDSKLTEELKWKQPCYTYKDSNVVIMSGFKAYCCLSFFKGSLMKDPKGLLQKPGKNSRAVGQLRFTSTNEVRDQEAVIRSYIEEAIALEKAGKTVDFSKNRDMPYPEELSEMLDQDPELKEAFEALTPGRKRGYLIYFNGAKQSQTRINRIERSRDNIFKGKGYQGR